MTDTMMPSKWKPTDKMLEIASDGYTADGDYVGLGSLENALIAVQPLIAEEARAKAMEDMLVAIDTRFLYAIAAIRALKQEKQP